MSNNHRGFAIAMTAASLLAATPVIAATDNTIMHCASASTNTNSCKGENTCKANANACQGFNFFAKKD